MAPGAFPGGSEPTDTRPGAPCAASQPHPPGPPSDYIPIGAARRQPREWSGPCRTEALPNRPPGGVVLHPMGESIMTHTVFPPEQRAVVLIDLANDFLYPGG